MHILVTGGSGFIGRRVCKRAVDTGHSVTSVSRSGEPTGVGCGPWTDSAEWVAADAFAPHDWRDALTTVDCVVHAIGTISESPDAGVTLERLNGDSAILAALEAERADVDRFVYVSSSNKPPLVRDAYITARRRAERAIADLDVETVIPRFGPVYGPNQPHFPDILNRLFAALGRFEPVARRFDADRPLSVERTASIVFELATIADPPSNPITAPTLTALAE